MNELNNSVKEFETVKIARINETETTINLDEDIIMVNADGVIIRIAAESVRVCARPSKGVTVMRIKEGNKVVAVVSAPHEESAEVITEVPDTSDADNAEPEVEETTEE